MYERRAEYRRNTDLLVQPHDFLVVGVESLSVLVQDVVQVLQLFCQGLWHLKWKLINLYLILKQEQNPMQEHYYQCNINHHNNPSCWNNWETMLHLPTLYLRCWEASTTKPFASSCQHTKSSSMESSRHLDVSKSSTLKLLQWTYKWIINNNLC